MLRTLLASLILMFLTHYAWAENCWMVGCSDSVGYIRIKPSSLGKPLPFAGQALPNAGQTVTLCEHAYLRVYAIAKPMESERREEVAGNLLGPNTKVKVLEYVSRNRDPRYAGDFAIVRVIDDDNTCPSECSKCGGVVY